uniref:F5/8 type C domain-containing protein n=2 Tax=Bursaphelenchus xylophilus TaxID=6326 RepID=A0A1I7SJF5_BURXY
SILEMEVDGNWIKTQMWFPGGHSAGTAKIVRTDPSSTCS